jgi:hypothetical protein
MAELDPRFRNIRRPGNAQAAKARKRVVSNLPIGYIVTVRANYSYRRHDDPEFDVMAKGTYQRGSELFESWLDDRADVWDMTLPELLGTPRPQLASYDWSPEWGEVAGLHVHILVRMDRPGRLLYKRVQDYWQKAMRPLTGGKNAWVSIRPFKDAHRAISAYLAKQHRKPAA